MTIYSKPAMDLKVERAVAAERERCAKIVEAIPFENDGQEYACHVAKAAKKIRSGS